MLHKFFQKPQKSPYELEMELLQTQLSETKSALESAYSNFENVLDPDLIDCYIYELNAVQKRYKFLLNQAKSLEYRNLATASDLSQCEP